MSQHSFNSYGFQTGLHLIKQSRFSRSVSRGVITGCFFIIIASLSSGLRARKLLGKKFFLANAFFGITGFSELANSLSASSEKKNEHVK